MRYIRVVASIQLFTEQDATGFISLIVDTQPSSPVAVARCSDGAQAQAIVDALNAV
jgi:hypothetical protein